MSLGSREGRVKFLTIAIAKIQPELSLEMAANVARRIVSGVRVLPLNARGEVDADPVTAALDSMEKEFDAADVGTVVHCKVYPSFLADVGQWVNLPYKWLKACQSTADRAEKVLPAQPDAQWREILPSPEFSADERFAYAIRLMKRTRELDEAERKQNRDALSRYEPGCSYGNLYFVGHPYAYFPDDQIWMTPDGRLYWINERYCLVEAFRQGVLKSAPMVALAWTVVIASAAVAVGTVAIPALAKAGYAAYVWGLLHPVEATGLGWAGVEVVLSVNGVDVPPVTPADELAFLVATPLKKGAKVGTAYVLKGVERTLESAKVAKIKGIVQSAELLDELGMKALNQGNKMYAISATAGKAATATKTASTVTAPAGKQAAATAKAAQAAVQLSPSVIQSLKQRMTRAWGESRAQEVVSALVTSGDQLLLEAASRFFHAEGIQTVLIEALSGSPIKKDGARFVLRYCLANIAADEPMLKLMRFELRRVMPGATRIADLKLGNLRFEFKSVKRVARRYATGGKEDEFGQLARDLFDTLGASPGDAFDRVKNLRWIFNGDKLPAGVTAEQIATRLGDALESTNLFKNWPRMNELKENLKSIVKIWPEKG